MRDVGCEIRDLGYRVQKLIRGIFLAHLQDALKLYLASRIPYHAVALIKRIPNRSEARLGIRK